MNKNYFNLMLEISKFWTKCLQESDLNGGKNLQALSSSWNRRMKKRREEYKDTKKMPEDIKDKSLRDTNPFL